MKGKAKIDFEQWYDNEFNGYEYLSHRIKRMKSRFHFWDMPNCFQEGVLREFFESKGIYVENMFNVIDSEIHHLLKVWKNKICIIVIQNKDYSTAFTTAIDKACEIYGGEG